MDLQEVLVQECFLHQVQEMDTYKNDWDSISVTARSIAFDAIEQTQDCNQSSTYFNIRIRYWYWTKHMNQLFREYAS